MFSPSRLRKLHWFLANLWAVLLVPTIIWWRTSVLWVALVSIYANWISEVTAWQAARVEVRAEQLQESDHQLAERSADALRRTEAQNLTILLWLRETEINLQEIKDMLNDSRS